MKQLCLIMVLIFFTSSAVMGAQLRSGSATFTLQQKKNNKVQRVSKKVEQKIGQVQRNVTNTISRQLNNVQKNIRIPKISNNTLGKTPALTKGFQKPKTSSLTKGTTLLSKELGNVDRSKLLASPIILKSPIAQKEIKTTKKVEAKKGLTTAKNTSKTNKNLVNTPKVPKVVFVLPVPPVAKKITLPKSLVRR